MATVDDGITSSSSAAGKDFSSSGKDMLDDFLGDFSIHELVGRGFEVGDGNNSDSDNVHTENENENVGHHEEEGGFHDLDYVLEDGDDDLVSGIEEARQPRKKTTSSGRQRNDDQIGITGYETGMRFKLEENSSDYGDSDALYSGSDSEKEGRVTYPEFLAERDLEDPKFKIGMLFTNCRQFKEACRNHGINNRHQIRFKRNEKKIVEAVCKGLTFESEKCMWRVYASRLDFHDEFNYTMQVKRGIFVHTCIKVNANYHLTARWIAKRYLEDFRSDPDWKISALIDDIGRTKGLIIGRTKAFRAKAYALEKINGDERSQYDNIYRYRAELLRSNPGSTVMGRFKDGIFVGMYVCLNALKSAFLASCRPFIGLDGCWLKGLYGGQLLSAVGVDPNDCIFPIAYAVVETESTETWSWFLQLLASDLGIGNNKDWTFMSDRQKGLINAIETLFPQAEHRFCVRHMYTNFRTLFKGKELKDMLWDPARAPYPAKFDSCMEKIGAKYPEARQWLEGRPAMQWSRAFFKEESKCDMLLNNMCECFNKYILDARDKGIITMNEMIKIKLMKWMKKKRDLLRSTTARWCPKIMKKLVKNIDFAVHFAPIYSGGPSVQVNGFGNQYVVDMNAKTCTCRRWQLTGIPCSHASAAIIGNNDNPANYLDNCYSLETYMKVYGYFIEPTNGSDQWPNLGEPVLIVPPSPVRVKRGRKKKNRRKEPEELEEYTRKGKLGKKGTIMTCSKCGRKDHNRRTCKEPPSTTEPSVKKRRGATARNNEASSPNLRMPNSTRQSSAKGAGKNAARTNTSKENTSRPNLERPPSAPQTMRWMMDGTTQYVSTHSIPFSYVPNISQESNGTQGDHRQQSQGE